MLDLRGRWITSHPFNMGRKAWWRVMPAWGRYALQIKDLCQQFDATSAGLGPGAPFGYPTHIGGDGSYRPTSAPYGWVTGTGGQFVGGMIAGQLTWGLHAWFMANAGDINDELIFQDASAAGEYLRLYGNTAGTGKPSVTLALGPTPTLYTAAGSVTAADGKWHYLMAARGGGAISLYMDTAFIGSVAVGSSVTNPGVGFTVKIAPTWSVNAYFDSLAVFSGFSGYRANQFEEMAGCPNTINWMDGPNNLQAQFKDAPAVGGGPWPFFYDEQSGGLQTQGMAL
jgi:hypothetical protein